MANSQRDPEREVFWRGVIQRQASSGLNVRAFCRREELKENSFYAWRRTIAERDDASNSQPAFVAATLHGEANHDQPLVLALASGLQLHVPSATPATRVAELVRALQTQPAS